MLLAKFKQDLNSKSFKMKTMKEDFRERKKGLNEYFIVLGFVFLLCFFSFPFLSGQAAYLHVQNITDDEGWFSFPVLSGKDIYVIDKVNNHLQLGELEIINGKNDKSIFDWVTRPKYRYYGRKTDLSYQVLSNSDQNFAVCFDESSCGMTCHYWRSYHNFNPRNGDRYSSLRDFFSEENYKTFHAYVTVKRQFNIQLQLLKGESPNKYFPFFWNYLMPSISEDDLNSYYFNRDSIFFDSFNLTSKNDPLRDAVDHVVGITIKDIECLLNDFGRAALISGNSLDYFRSASEPQLYEGKIGDNLIYMLFREEYINEDEEVTEYSGIYAYKKYGRGINLYGKGKYGDYELFERDEELEDKALLKFTIEDNILKGTWSDLKTNRELPFKVQRR